MSGTRIKAFYFCIFGIQGVLFPYLALWLLSKGPSHAEISILLMMTNLSKLISNPIAGYLADRRFGAFRVMMICSAFSTAFYVLYVIPTPGYIPIFIAIALASFTVPPMFPMADRAAIGLGVSRAFGFGSKRAWGSLGFAAGTGLAACTVGWFGVASLPWLILTLSATGLCVAISLTRLCNRDPKALDKTCPAASGRVKNIVWVLLCSSALLQASNGYLYSTASLEWQSAGLSTSAIAVVWIYGIGVEIAFFILGAKICSRVQPHTLILLAGIMTAIRWTVLGTSPHLTAIFIAQTLQLFTISMNVMATARIVSDYVPDQWKGRAFSTYNVFSGGVFFSFAIAGGTYFRRNLGLSGFLAMAIVALASLGLAAIASRIDNSRQPSSKPH